MHLNSIAKHCAGAGALAFALALAAPAVAEGGHQADVVQAPPPPPGAVMPPMPGPGMHHGGPPPMMEVDPRAREAWLDECRHRMSRHDHDDRRAYDYCEAYFDNYYASYRFGGYGYGYPQMTFGYAYAVPMMMVPVRRQVGERECVREVVSEYVPVRRRVIQRPRAVPDKRVRVAPDKRERVN